MTRALGLASLLAVGCGSSSRPSLPIDAAADASSPSSLLEVDPQYQNDALAVDDVNVYWVRIGQTYGESAILAVPRAGGIPITLVQGAESGNIATDGEYVYWSAPLATALGARVVARVPAGGGSVQPLASDSPICITVDDTNVYWTSGGVLSAVPKGGGVVRTLSTLGADGAIASDATHVYSGSWVDGSPGLMAVPKAGGIVTTLLAPSIYANCRVIALGPGHAIVPYLSGATWLNDALGSVPLDGGASPTVLDSTHDAALVVANATTVYWVGNLPVLGVYATPIAGGSTRTLATPATHAIHDLALASDGTLYWTTDRQIQWLKP